jgi:LPXTG-motif cell wall-anchored protein
MKRLFKAITVFSFITCFILFASTSLEAKAETLINFCIVSPQDNSIQYDDLKIVILPPSSTYQIAEVRAKVEDREAALKCQEDSGWVGNLNLSGLSRGNKTIEVTAKDIKGNIATNKFIIRHTQQPTLIVNSPKDLDFSNGSLNLDVKASDLAGEKCTIQAYIPKPYGDREQIAKSMDRMNQTVDLSKYNGQSKNITFEATNESGGTSTITKKVNIDSSSFLGVKDKVDGEILDYKNNKILYKTAKNELKIKDLQTSSEQLVYSHDKNLVLCGYLTPLGAMFVVKNVSPNYACESLFEFKNNALSYIGRGDNTFLKVNGNYAIWNGDSKPIDTPEISSSQQLNLKDLVTNNIVQVSNEAGNNNNDVTSKGEVVYWAMARYPGEDPAILHYNIYKYYNGKTIKISKNDRNLYMYPLSDGSITVYSKSKNMESGYNIILNYNGQEQVIATSNDGVFNPGDDYQVNNGYVAFTNYVEGVKQVFLWADGSIKQLTHFGTDSYIESLNEQGNVIAKSNNGYFVIKNDNSQPVKLYSIAGLKNYWSNNELFGAIDGSLLKIEANITPVIVPVKGITLSDTDLKLTRDQEVPLDFAISPTNATNKNVTWSSSDPSVATVDPTGKVKAVGIGNAVVTATTEDGRKTATCSITVANQVIPVTSVSLNKTENTLSVGDTETLIATVNPNNATNKNVTWTSGNASVATVDPTGKVKAVGIGNAVITATSEDGKKTATYNVTVKKNGYRTLPETGSAISAGNLALIGLTILVLGAVILRKTR